MNILSVDTTSPSAGVAIMKDGNIVAGFTSSTPVSHSVSLMPMIDASLRSVGMTVGDIDLFACTAGPGSFTGVRIGASVIKGLAAKDGIPCVGVSTIAAMAEGMTLAEGIICPVMNARRAQVYTGVFICENGSLRRVTEDALVPLAALIALLRGESCDGFDFTDGMSADAVRGKRVYFTGDAYAMAMEAAAELDTAVTPSHLLCTGAAGAAMLAERIYADSAYKDAFRPELLLPVYLRKPQAQREYEERMAAAAGNDKL